MAPPPQYPPSEQHKSMDMRPPISDTVMRQEGTGLGAKPSWLHLFAFVNRQHAGLLVSAVAAAMAVAGAKTFYAVVLGKIFDIVSKFGAGKIDGDDTLAGVSTWCVVLTAVGGAIWLANAGFMALWIIFGEVCAKSARDTLFTALLRKEMGWFDSQGDGLSSMLVRIQGQTRELQTATSQVLGYLVCDALISVACLVVAFYYSWKLSLVLLATIPVSVLVLSLVSRPLEPAIEKQKLALSQGSKLVNAAVSAIDLVKVYNGSDQEVWPYLQTIKQAMKQYLVQARCNCLQMSYIKFWMINLFVVGFWFAVHLVGRGETTPGKALTTFYAALTAFEAIESVGPQWLVLAKGMSAGQSLQAIALDLQRGRRIRRLEGWQRPKKCSGDIEVNGVTFAYPSNPTRTALTRASFFFPAGETSFLVGRSGSGKSTIGNLLVKFYKPQEGQILVDGQPLQTLDMDWVRSNITLIQQSNVLFNDTVFMNVAFGHRNPEQASKEDVKAACEAALLQSTITGLSDGYNTMLGSGGCSLSGGQKQRLALARARLRDPPVLILDEVTSGLDPVSKALIMDAIRVWRRGKTTIIITHDVSQIQDEEDVYVLDQSYLVQEGFKRDLVQQKSGVFASLLASSGEDCDSSISSSPSTSSYDDFQSDVDMHDVAHAARVSTIFPSVRDSLHVNRGLFRLSLGMGTAQMTGLRAREFRESSQISDKPTLIPELDHNASRTMSVRNSRDSFKNMNKYNFRAHSEAGSSFRSSIEVLQEIGDAIRAGRRSRTTKDYRGHMGSASGFRRALPSLKSSTKDLQQQASTNGRVETHQLRTIQIVGTVWPILDNQSRLLFILGFGFCLIVAACNPAFAFVFAKLLQSFWAEGDRAATGQKWAICLTVIAAIDANSVYFGHYFMERTAQTWMNNLRTEALKRVLSQPRPWFDYPSHSAGRIVECLDKNAEEMRNLVGRFVPIIIMVAAMVTCALIWALVISWKLTLVALSAGPAVYLATWASSMASDRWEARCNTGAESNSAVFSEVFSNIRVVRALTLEPLFTKKHLRSTTSAFRLGVKRGLYTGIFYGLYQSMSFWLTALVFWYGTVLLRRHDHGIEVADIMQVINLLLFSMGTATMMLGSVPQISQAKVSATQLLYFANLSHQASHEGRGRRLALTLFPIRMSNLKFAYPGQSAPLVLRNVNLRIDAGDFIAIVGASGSGKSTVASLLLRLYEPSKLYEDEDTVALPSKSSRSLDGNLYHQTRGCAKDPLTFAHVSSSELDTAVLRNMMAYVPQQPFLFPATIRDNIVYGLHDESPLRDMGNVQRAAQAADIHDFVISLPDGYQTVVGDGGLSLSGGQTQRISIARALARQPKLLVLDEPTSALDAESAEAVRHTIKHLTARSSTSETDRLYPGVANRMAVVMVTHSKEAMTIADRIVVIDGGCVVEEGVYEELVAKEGKFAELVSGGAWMERSKGPRKMKMKSDTAQDSSKFLDEHDDMHGSITVEEDEEDIAHSALTVAAARSETLQALERPRSAVVRGQRSAPNWYDR